MKQKFITDSYEETQELGKKIGSGIRTGQILALYGNLGSGKTTFVQGIAMGLGIKQKIISPTFIIVRKYEIPPNSLILNLKSFYHIDLYRIENENDISGLGLDEIINNPENIVAIEWPEKIKKLLPKNKKGLFFEYLKNDRRSIKLEEL